MTMHKRVLAVKAEIVSDPTVMSGEPVVRGTRILAETILSYLKANESAEQIFRDYPSLPVDGINAAVQWAENVYGPDWKTKKLRHLQIERALSHR